MILWPLSKEHLQRLEDTLASKFDNPHTVELINDANAGYIAYSETLQNKKTKTTINVSEPVILSLIVEHHLESFVEHEYLQVKGTGDHNIASLNPPEIIQDSLWDMARQMITDTMLDTVKCTNVIIQQQLAKDYVEFECKKFEYLFEKYDSMILQAVKLITYGYLDVLCEHLKVEYKTQKDRWDIFDLSIHQAAKEVFDEFIFLRKESNSVNLFDSCVKLDMKIRQQKKIF